MSYTAVKTQLKNILASLDGAGQPLQQVYNYFEVSPQAYPCGMVRTWGGGTKERLDSANDWLTMRFLIRVLVREKNTEAVETSLDTLLDEFVAKLNESSIVDTLNGVVEKFDVEDIVPIEIPDMDMPVAGFDIIVSASKIQSIT